MNVRDILARLRNSESVVINAIDSMEFIRECERLGETRIEIRMDIDWPRCTLSAPEYTHKKRVDST